MATTTTSERHTPTPARIRTDKVARSERQNAHRKEMKAEMDALKSRPCMDCQQTYPPEVMDFDHRPEEVKLFNLGAGSTRNRSITAIQLEIAKCDLVCANCHRLRTMKRRKPA